METLSSVSIPKRKDDTHKGDYGRILLIGGNGRLGGANILAGRGRGFLGGGVNTKKTNSK